MGMEGQKSNNTHLEGHFGNLALEVEVKVSPLWRVSAGSCPEGDRMVGEGRGFGLGSGYSGLVGQRGELGGNPRKVWGFRRL